MRIRSVGFIKGSSPWSPFHPWAVKVNERPEQQEADVRLYQTTPLSALFYCAIYTVNRLPWKKEQTYGRAKVTFWATHPSDSVVSLSRPKTHSPLLKKEKKCTAKRFCVQSSGFGTNRGRGDCKQLLGQAFNTQLWPTDQTAVLLGNFQVWMRARSWAFPAASWTHTDTDTLNAVNLPIQHRVQWQTGGLKLKTAMRPWHQTLPLFFPPFII